MKDRHRKECVSDRAECVHSRDYRSSGRSRLTDIFRNEPVVLLQLVAESCRDIVAPGTLANQQPEFASATVSGQWFPLACHRDAQHHSCHMIPMVFVTELIRQCVGDCHVCRHVRYEMAVKQPMTGGWSPIGVHRPSPAQPISVHYRLFSQRKCMIRLAIARTVDAEVGSMHVHGMRRVASIDPP